MGHLATTALALWLAAPALAQTMQLTILHTNDIHGHVQPWTGWEGDLAGQRIGGFDRLAAAVSQVRAQTRNVLLLDAGDTLGDTAVAVSTKGAAVIELMNAVGYDAMTVGNHEPDFGMDVLRTRIAEAKFPVLAANVVRQGSDETFTKPFTIREVAGVKVGILGLAYPNTPLTTAKKNVEGFEFRQARETAERYLPRLRAEGAQLIVVLGHLGLNAEKRLAETVPGIDVIVGGHSHNRMREPLRVGSTVIVQAGAHLSDLGRLDLTLDGGRITSVRRELITMTHDTVPSDPRIAARMRNLQSDAAQRTLATAASTVVRAQTIAGQQPEKRDAESPADSLFADLIREHTKAGAVILPGVGYAVAAQPGPFTSADLKNFVPHESKLVSMRLKGSDILEILEQSLENVYTEDTEQKVGGMVQLSGVTFSYHPEGTKGSRVRQAEIAGKPLSRNETYVVVTNGMLAQGGHRYTAFLRGAERRELSSQYEVLERQIASAHAVKTPPPGRIKKTK